MKSYKERLNIAASKGEWLKVLSVEESDALKNCILGIYKAVSSLCRSYGLSFMLGGGSCLGAIRHKGFIPWDDDLDLLMPRPDYQKLIELLESGALGKSFSFTYPNEKTDSPSMFLKVYRDDTIMMGLDGENSPYPQKVFIDVFPLDGYSPFASVRKVKGFLANLIRLCANMVSEAHPLTEAQKRFYSTDRVLLRIVMIRRFLGKILSVISHKKWVCLFDHLVRNYDMNGLVGIPTGRKLYEGEVFQASSLIETSYAEFEGIQVTIPSGWDPYLKNLYGDYMVLPPDNNKERHFFQRLVIDNNQD